MRRLLAVRSAWMNVFPGDDSAFHVGAGREDHAFGSNSFSIRKNDPVDVISIHKEVNCFPFFDGQVIHLVQKGLDVCGISAFVLLGS